MDARPIVYALIIGWAVGSEPLPPTFAGWVSARDDVQAGPQAIAECRLDETPFVLKQVVLDFRSRP